MSEASSEALVAARQHMERWRERHGGRGCRIPESLWTEAVGVARLRGLEATARELGLSRERLRTRMDAEGVIAGGSDHEGPAFVELGMGPLGGGRTVIELLRRDGERMRIEVTGPTAVDWAGLTRSFWERPS